MNFNGNEIHEDINLFYLFIPYHYMVTRHFNLYLINVVHRLFLQMKGLFFLICFQVSSLIINGFYLLTNGIFLLLILYFFAI